MEEILQSPSSKALYQPFHTLREIEYRGHNLVFIVGCPRSGTTWLQRLLASHPKIITGQESHLFDDYVGPQMRIWQWELERESNPRTATGRGGIGLSCYFDEQDFLVLLKSYMLQLLNPMISRLKPGEFFLEKTPEHGMFIPEIKQLLPECRIINILRDARDVVASVLAASRSWGSSWAPRNARGAALRWVERVEATRDATRKLSEREFCEVTYEELWASTDRVLKRLSEFLGIVWTDDEIREAIEANRPEVMKAGGGTPLPIYGEVAKRTGPVAIEPKDFVRRPTPGGWKKDLSLWEKFQVWRIASGTMAEVGYPSSLSRWLFIDRSS